MPVSTIEPSLEEQALSQFNAGKYKEAIELYKKLLQGSDRPEWQQQLADCYLQRALAFAAKGMGKEALVLWENYSRHTQPPYQAYDQYLSWLIQTKNQDRFQACLAQLSVQQLDKQYPELAALLGFLIITGQDGFSHALPQDSAFVAHLKLAQTALQAYQENNPDGVEEALRQLPYRSAFRDFRHLLKAAVAFSTSMEEAQALLSKIPADSVYAQAAKLLLACTRQGAQLAQELVPFDPQQRRLVAEIIGLNKKQLALIDALNSQNGRGSDKAQFNLALQYQSLCGTEAAQSFCFALLPSYPAGQREFNKNFGSLAPFEENRLKALAHENADNSYDANYYWRQSINALSREDSDNALKTALILRRMAGMQQEPEDQIPLLIESLEHDPEDLGSYLAILRYYGGQQGTAKHYKQWLNKTLKKFPKDLVVLTLALQTAERNKAYSKASQHALTILKVDPLNTFAKQALFSSYLAQARKHIQDKKYDSAEQEIQQAEALKIGKNSAYRTRLMRGLLCFAAQDKKQGLQLIAEALTKQNSDPVNSHFQAAMEALLTGFPVATLLRELPPAKDYALSAKELSRLIELIKQYDQEASNPELIHKALEKVKAPLKKSVLEQPYDEDLLLGLCQILDSIKHFELLRHCARWANVQWKKPIWLYYRVYSDTNGNPEKCSYLHSRSLQANLDRARQEKDHRAMVLIGDYLDRYHLTHSTMGMDFFDDLFNPDGPDEGEDPFNKLFGHLSDEIFYKLDKKIESLAKKTSPERLVQELEKVIGHNSNLLFAIMQNPDLFTALMLLRAADMLDININVSVEDVLACFDVGKKSNPFPFF